MSVIVLTPNGRRQPVKVTPNTTLLYILEEACQKHGFQPELYNLRHHRKVLDVTLTVRFAGLPNNCQLEMIAAEIARTTQPVTVGVQTEDGKRVMDEFNTSSTIQDVLMKLCPKEVTTNTVVIYMRSEMYGDALKKSTLKSLGITSGRAMLRLIHRSPEELKTQANVSAPIPPKPVEEKPYKRQFQPVESTPQPLPGPTPQEKQETPSMNQHVANSDDINKSKSTDRDSDETESTVMPQKFMKNDNVIFDKLRQEKRKQTDGLKIKSQPQAHTRTANQEIKKEDFIFLGARNAMLFSYETAQAISNEDLPDDFFDLSITDVKKLFRDIKKRRLEMEGQQLMTSAMRELEDSKKQLRALNHYKKAVIRVQFPNRMVLQGIFQPNETIQEVLNFVREYIADKSLVFYLFTTPPKTVLQTSVSLLEAECVPGALLHFGCDDKRANYLRSDILDKVVSTFDASNAASTIRMNSKRVPYDKNAEDDLDISDIVQPDYVAPSHSTDAAAFVDYKMADRSPPEPKEKLPKWFKPTK